jgi:hypothetical protein
LVIALPAKTAYDDEVPRLTTAVAAFADWAKDASVTKAMPVTIKVPKESRRLRGTFPRPGARRARFGVFSEEE